MNNQERTKQRTTDGRRANARAIGALRGDFGSTFEAVVVVVGVVAVIVIVDDVVAAVIVVVTVALVDINDAPDVGDVL